MAATEISHAFVYDENDGKALMVIDTRGRILRHILKDDAVWELLDVIPDESGVNDMVRQKFGE